MEVDSKIQAMCTIDFTRLLFLDRRPRNLSEALPTTAQENPYVALTPTI
jgi:hypothetical protein